MSQLPFHCSEELASMNLIGVATFKPPRNIRKRVNTSCRLTNVQFREQINFVYDSFMKSLAVVFIFLILRTRQKDVEIIPEVFIDQWGGLVHPHV
jgi:hypothetical protein